MQPAANYAERYAAMSDSELADLVLSDPDSLNEEARSAFQAELRKRGLTLAKLREQYAPEPPSNDDESNSRGSLIQNFGFLGIPLVCILALALYFVLADKPFGIQVATLVAYTGYVFFFVFSNLRASKGYDLRQRAVRQKIPHLLVIHAVFLAIVFIGLTVALSLRPSLPPSWLEPRGRRGENWFELSILAIVFVTCMFQAQICRKILSRSVGVESGKLTRCTVDEIRR
jgi:hypothetical protein